MGTRKLGYLHANYGRETTILSQAREPKCTPHQIAWYMALNYAHIWVITSDPNQPKHTLQGLFVHPMWGSAFSVERFCFAFVVPLHTLLLTIQTYPKHIFDIAWPHVGGEE